MTDELQCSIEVWHVCAVSEEVRPEVSVRCGALDGLNAFNMSAKVPTDVLRTSDRCFAERKASELIGSRHLETATCQIRSRQKSFPIREDFVTNSLVFRRWGCGSIAKR